jgi:hypothetical protein
VVDGNQKRVKVGWIIIAIAIIGMSVVAFYTPPYISLPIGIFVTILAAKVGFDLNEPDRR